MPRSSSHQTRNLIDRFDDRAAAFEYLAAIGRANPEIAGDVFPIADEDDGESLAEVVFASSALS